MILQGYVPVAAFVSQRSTVNELTTPRCRRSRSSCNVLMLRCQMQGTRAHGTASVLLEDLRRLLVGTRFGWVQIRFDQLGWKMEINLRKGYIYIIDRSIDSLIKPYAYMFQSQVYKQQSSCQVDEPWPVDLSMFTWTSQTPGPKIHPDLGTLGSWKWRMNGKYTLEDWRLEPTNHPFRKENYLPNLHDYAPC